MAMSKLKLDQKFTTIEQEQLLRTAQENIKLILAPTSKSNSKEKAKLWEKVKAAVNSVSNTNRELNKIMKHWSDWKYILLNNKKKNLTALDVELLNALQNVSQDFEPDDNTKTRFDEDEKNLLTQLVITHYATLFGSFTSTITREVKEKTWQSIAHELNRTYNRGRNVNSIQEKWKKMASYVKGKSAKINKMNRTSGINDEEAIQLTDIESQIKEAIGEVAIDGIDGGIDTDCVHLDEAANNPPRATRKTIVKDASTKRALTYEDESVDSTQQLIMIEKQKLAVMSEQLEVDKKRLKVEENINQNLIQLNMALANGNNQPLQLPGFEETFSPVKLHSNDLAGQGLTSTNGSQQEVSYSPLSRPMDLSNDPIPRMYTSL